MVAEIAQLSTGPTIFHLRHPRPVSWSDVIHNFSSALKVPVASYQSWLSKLIEAAQSPDSEQTHFIAHAVKLLPIWKSIAAQAMEKGSLVPDSMGIGILLDIEDSAQHCTPLRDPSFPQIGLEDVRRWVDHWKRMGATPST